MPTLYRTMTFPQPPCEMVSRLCGTVNRDPIWGRPAQSLRFDGASFSRRVVDGEKVYELDLKLTDEFPRPGGSIPYAAEDWSAIEPSLPLAKAEPEAARVPSFPELEAAGSLEHWRRLSAGKPGNPFERK